MAECPTPRDRDWAASVPAYLAAWGLPTIIVLVGIFTSPGLRAILWTAALFWKGVACLLNARRCGRTHCRYTGPFYLLLIAPVLLHGLGLLPLGAWGWWLLGALILFGGKAIWVASEAAWGRYRDRPQGSPPRSLA